MKNISNDLDSVWHVIHYLVFVDPATLNSLHSSLQLEGDIVEFENLTIHFDDGSLFLCGPRLIAVGVNFTQQNGEWW
jgi:hypothetical protein